MKTLWKYAMTHVADLMLYVVNQFQPERLRAYVDSRVQQGSQELSKQVVMAYLNKEGLLHCYVCPSRWQLLQKTIDHKGQPLTVYLCHAHVQQIKAHVPAAVAKS